MHCTLVPTTVHEWHHTQVVYHRYAKLYIQGESIYVYHSVSYTVNTVYIAYHVQLCTSSLFDQSLHHCYFVLPSLHCTFPCNSKCTLTLYVMNIQIKCLWYTCPCGLTLSTWWCRLKWTIVIMD